MAFTGVTNAHGESLPSYHLFEQFRILNLDLAKINLMVVMQTTSHHQLGSTKPVKGFCFNNQFIQIRYANQIAND